LSEPDKSSSSAPGGGGGGFAVFCGIDVAREVHHAVALDAAGHRLADQTLRNDEAALRALFTTLTEHGRVLVVVDQPASIAALAIEVARAEGVDVAYLPGLAMRRLADLHPGAAKTDARDAFVIADAARALPHTLRRVGSEDETVVGLGVLAGYDADLAAEATRITNRLHDALLHVHPALERLLGAHLRRGGVLDLLATAPTPAALEELGGEGIRQVMAARSPRLAKTLPAQILTALAEQSVVIPGTPQYGRVITGLATSLSQVLDTREQLAGELETLLEAHPLAPVLTSLPGLGVRTVITVLLTVGDASAFPTAAHLASYAGLAPVTRQSGRSIRSEHAATGGHRGLKRGLYLSAFASLRDPASRAYYDRKRAEGKHHVAVLICLARRRTDVLHAMIKNRQPYRPPAPPARPSATAAPIAA
jgi:transposase